MQNKSSLLDLVNKLKAVCCIGPNVSFKSINENDENELLVSKEITKILSSIYDKCENPFIIIITDIIAGYESKHGSGSSSLLAYITFMLSEIIMIEDLDNVDILTIIHTFDMIHNEFIDICNSMKICLNNYTYQKLEETYDNIDDVNWYFNDDINENNDTQSNELTWSNDKIANGLQHCCYWDYEFNDENGNISLPMRLALNSFVPDNNQDIVKMIANKSSENNTILQLLPGLPIKYCESIQDAVIFTINDRNCIFALHEYICSKEFTDSCPLIFSSIAIVEGNFEPGNFGEGNGASEQIIKQKNKRIIKNNELNEFKTFLRSSSETKYLQICRKRLEELHIDLLIISNTYLSTSLMDICRELSIAVIAIHQNTVLKQFAKSSDTTIVNDILQLGDNQVGKNPVELKVLLRRQFQNSLNSKDIIHGTYSYSYNGSSGVFGDPRDGKFISGYDPSIKDEFIVQLRCISSSKNDFKVNSILIASPSLPQTAALADRCHRCLYRLQSIISGSPIIPGAGLPELMFSIHLMNISSLLDTNKKQICNAVQKSFIAFITTINIKNGFSWTESMERIKYCKIEFLKLSKQKDFESVNIVEILKQMTKDYTLMNVPSPIFDPNNDINIEPNDSNKVLDCLKIKTEVFNSALQTIKQLLSVKKIVKTYY